MEEYIRRFIEWTKLKVRIHIAENRCLYYREKEIWWTSLGMNIGYEQDGKNAKFERPVIIIKKFNKEIFWAIPTTTKPRDGSYYYNFTFKDQSQTIILPPLRLLSSKRLIRKIGIIDDDVFIDVKKKIKNYL
ncbi:MAG: type II toxin-antitoxin system PemK/MazF family toxin [Candidatus Komeilibacteria bacterium]